MLLPEDLKDDHFHLEQVTATDSDLGENGEIRYFLPVNLTDNGKGAFAINQYTGDIVVRQLTEDDRDTDFLLTVEAVDRGKGKGSKRQEVGLVGLLVYCLVHCRSCGLRQGESELCRWEDGCIRYIHKIFTGQRLIIGLSLFHIQLVLRLCEITQRTHEKCL